MATETFGPSALATPANAVTLVRLAMTPALLAVVVEHGNSWSAVLLWIALSVSDGLDGYLARRQGTTRSGAFLDPLADKILVLGAMIALVTEDIFWWFPVALIGAREVVISAYRSVMGRQGVSVPARFGAKVKTVAQEVAVGFALLPTTRDHEWLADGFLWLSVVLALVTGARYLLDHRQAARAL